MNVSLTCPKCQAQLELDASLVGSRSECPTCGQLFIVGKLQAELPVAPVRLPDGSATPNASRAGKSKGGLTREGEWQRRKCACCGATMITSFGSEGLVDFLLPIGRTTCWQCERCGKEIKIQSSQRILILVIATPLIALWWIILNESLHDHGPDAPWWKRALEDMSPTDSKGRFGYFILFLLLALIPPLALARELFVRLRYPRIV